jgi:hypothetical protein
MTIYSKKSARRQAIRTLLHAADYLVRRAIVAKTGALGLPDFLACVILIQAAHKLGYHGPLLQFDKVK